VDFLDLVTEVIDLQIVFESVVLDRARDPVVKPVALDAGRALPRRGTRAPGRSARGSRTCTRWPRSTATRILAVTDQSAPVLMGVATFIASGACDDGLALPGGIPAGAVPADVPGDAGRRVDDDDGAAVQPDGIRGCRRELRMHRIYVQMLGVLFIFLTAFWGMYTNVTVGPLG
jgi:hypothetical protein